MALPQGDPQVFLVFLDPRLHGLAYLALALKVSLHWIRLSLGEASSLGHHQFRLRFLNLGKEYFTVCWNCWKAQHGLKNLYRRLLVDHMQQYFTGGNQFIVAFRPASTFKFLRINKIGSANSSAYLKTMQHGDQKYLY